MSSFITATEATEAYKSLTSLFGLAKLELRKWDSNSEEVLSNIPSSHQDLNNQIDKESSSTIKALEIAWDSKKDCFHFLGFIPKLTRNVTKRHILSEMSRVFDPLGFLSPITVTVKLLFQKLWLPVRISGTLTCHDGIPSSIAAICF